MMRFAVLRTDSMSSLYTLRSSMALIRRRCMYPDFAVRTAVSTRDSRPDTESMKNSVGWRPRLNEDAMKPFWRPPLSPRLK